MPAYEYTGQLPQGTAMTGTFEADNIDEARSQLSALAIQVATLAETPRIRSRRALSREDLLFFNQQLASLAENRIALDEGLRAVARDIRRSPLRSAIEELAADLESGLPLDQAVAKQSGRFPALYADVLKSGAENNQLGATLLNLNNHLTLIDSTRRMILETMTYPLIILAMLACLVTFLMIAVVPGFEDVVAGMAGLDWNANDPADVVLPGPTRMLFALSRSWPAILGVAGPTILLLVVAWFASGKYDAGRRLRSRLSVLIPGLAGAQRASLVARFTNAAALGARAGQPLPALIRAAAGATGSASLSHDAEAIAKCVEAGGPAAQTAIRTRMIPSLVTYTIQVAGARGQLVDALADLARTYDIVARHKMAIVRILIRPIVIFLVGAVIGIVVASLMLPMVSLINSLTGG